MPKGLGYASFVLLLPGSSREGSASRGAKKMQPGREGTHLVRLESDLLGETSEKSLFLRPQRQGCSLP